MTKRLDKDINLYEEAQEFSPKTGLQRKVVGNLDKFELQKRLAKAIEVFEVFSVQEDMLLKAFLAGYEQLAINGTSFEKDKLDILFDISKEINIIKSFDIKEAQYNDRLDKVIFVDSVAHNLHKKKFEDGSSQYKILDELADISKSFGERNRDDRLLILNTDSNIDKLMEYTGFEILTKGKIMDKSKSLWRLLEKAIKVGVEKLPDEQLVILREWLYAKI